MKSLSESLHFSTRNQHPSAVKINKWRDINHYETLTLYCAENDIDLRTFTDSDIESAVLLLANHGQNDKATDHFYFWIDPEIKTPQG